eukprot:2611288-Alexandrium_andersonii.AAC.1
MAPAAGTSSTRQVSAWAGSTWSGGRRRPQSETPARNDSLRPWGAIFQRASSQSDVETQAFWNREVTNKPLF